MGQVGELRLSRGEGRPAVFARGLRPACRETLLPLHFGTANLFLLIGEELLEAGLFVRLIKKALESARLLFGLVFLLLQLFKLPTETVDPAGLFFQFAISLGKKSINDFLPPLQNGLFRKCLFCSAMTRFACASTVLKLNMDASGSSSLRLR